MYDKIASMERIRDIGLNMHRWFVPETIGDYFHILNLLQHCSIRTDHATQTKDMPFYTLNHEDGPYAARRASVIWDESMDKGYKLIISDGIKYDPVQEYNMMIKIAENGDFDFEASPEKVPLRHMYRYPLLSCIGNVGEETHEWFVRNQRYDLNRINIRHDLGYLYEQCFHHDLFNHWLELTKYPIPVGIQERQIVFWQII